MSALTDAIKNQFELQNKTITALKKELHAAKKLLWATIYVNGHSVRIPSEIMQQAENDQELGFSYDAENKITVLRSIVSIPKLNPSSNEPDQA
jgi:hypothetical protein